MTDSSIPPPVSPTPVTKPARRPRAYLDKEHRRRMIIEQAAAMVESRAWSELSMSALAKQAGISRQLVYQHFPNLESLLLETAGLIFTDVWNRTQRVVEDPSLDLVTAIRQAAVLSLDLETGRGDALWQLIAGMNRHSRELSILSLQIRNIIIDIWAPRIGRELGLKKPGARALAWMLLMAFWGVRQMVRDGSITRKQAMDQFDQLIARALLSDTPITDSDD